VAKSRLGSSALPWFRGGLLVCLLGNGLVLDDLGLVDVVLEI